MKIFPLELRENNFKILVLYLNTDSVVLITQELNKKLKISPNVFKNLAIIIDVEKIHNIKNWDNIKNLIISFNFRIIGVSGCQNDNLKKLITKSGLLVLEKNRKLCNIIYKFKSNTCLNVKNNRKKTKIVDFPVRSGQKIYAANSDLIIANNVNPGAEIIADGNVHVYGNMRGRVLAGANGDITSQIFCINFFSELISIAGEYLLSDQFPKSLIGKSVRIYVKNKKLKIFKID
ncbi:septum formation inhibitor [Buchnera aphidicola (Schlechtendalia chinensis)]|uniref:Probable septum site-determining protein MinC n=1 Tax=Buchnera aphidicola subsp. Schlechtendalia chinensis TaxID=118110 RepID=A0A172WDR4_BUCSC|nr:septum site-determining protein MinC [Buchnera aphidicola]ANF17082.1 septum formation inhibitor [Buchnera aphidicola (Schlechtendalia chinensis)]